MKEILFRASVILLGTLGYLGLGLALASAG